MIIADILEICKNGYKKDKIIEETHLSHDQLRRITAEMVDKEFLHYIENQEPILQQIRDTYFLLEDND